MSPIQLPNSRLTLEYKFFEKNSTMSNEKKSFSKKLNQVDGKKNRYSSHLVDNVSSQTSSSIKSFFHDKQHLNGFVVNENSSSFNQPVYRINPIYPNKEKLLKIEGEVTVKYDVNINGGIENIRILHSFPPRVFDDSVCSAMIRWVYERNNPKSNLIVTFKFKLKRVKKFRN